MNEVEKRSDLIKKKTRDRLVTLLDQVIQNNLQAEFCHWYNGQNHYETQIGFYCPKKVLKLHLTFHLSAFALKQCQAFLSDHLLIKTPAHYIIHLT